MTDKPRFYGDSISGNCYKLQLAAAELELAYDWQEIDIMKGQSQTPEFLALNSNGKVPVMQLPDGRCLAESNAILSYLAESSDLAGSDRYARGLVMQWMFFEQYYHEPYIATSRFIVKYQGTPDARRAELEAKIPGGHRALALMEQELSEHEYFANDAYSIADIALYAYTHVAHEGGFDLAGYPAIRDWLRRIEARPRYVPMGG